LPVGRDDSFKNVLTVRVRLDRQAHRSFERNGDSWHRQTALVVADGAADGIGGYRRRLSGTSSKGIDHRLNDLSDGNRHNLRGISCEARGDGVFAEYHAHQPDDLVNGHLTVAVAVTNAWL